MPKISALPSATSVANPDYFVLDQSSVTKKVTASLVLTYVQTSITITDANFSGLLALDHGGTNANLTADNGGIVYSTDAALAILAATATANQMLRSGANSGPNWSTATFAGTYNASDLLYSNGANTIEGLATGASAMLRTTVAGVPAWSAALTNGQVMIGSTGGTPAPATLTAGAGITIGNAANSITISGGGSGYTWTEVTGTSQNMAVNNGYIANNVALVTLTLPATASVGDTIILQGKGTGLYRIAQNAGQTIHFGSSDTSTGAGGSLTATNRYDSIELICIVANTDFAVLTGAQGAFTIA